MRLFLFRCIMMFSILLFSGDKMDDYAKVKYKTTGRLAVMKFMVNGGMNPDVSNVDFVQDGDLNKSLKHYVSWIQQFDW